MKAHCVYETFEHLENLLEKSEKFFLVILTVRKMKTLSFVPFYFLFSILGLKFSRSFYDEIEQKHARYTQTVFRAVCVFVFAVYIPAACQPLMYLIFGYPEPNKMNLPHGYRWVWSKLFLFLSLSFCSLLPSFPLSLSLNHPSDQNVSFFSPTASECPAISGQFMWSTSYFSALAVPHTFSLKPPYASTSSACAPT